MNKKKNNKNNKILTQGKLSYTKGFLNDEGKENIPAQNF